MNVYLASSTDNRHWVSLLAECLTKDAGVTIVGNWWHTPPVEDLAQRAELDFTAIEEANIIVAVSPYGYGTSSEIGYALGQKKPVIYWSNEFSLEDAPLPVGLLLKRNVPDIVTTYRALLNRIHHYEHQWEDSHGTNN